MGRHMEQKERPASPSLPSQREGSGKGAHEPVDDAHRRCSPIVSVTVPPEGEGTERETHLGETMEVMVRTVAVGEGGSVLVRVCIHGVVLREVEILTGRFVMNSRCPWHASMACFHGMHATGC